MNRKPIFAEDGFKIFERADGLLESTHFSAREFACSHGACKFCGGLMLADKWLLVGLERFRRLIGNKRIRILSGFRCERHNAAVGGAAKSQHLKGLAADLAAIDGDWALNAADTIRAAQEAGFTGIGHGKNKLHVDKREGCMVIWNYDGYSKLRG